MMRVPHGRAGAGMERRVGDGAEEWSDGRWAGRENRAMGGWVGRKNGALGGWVTNCRRRQRAF